MKDLDFAMFAPVKSDARQLRTPEQKRVAKFAAIERDAVNSARDMGNSCRVGYAACFDEDGIYRLFALAYFRKRTRYPARQAATNTAVVERCCVACDIGITFGVTSVCHQHIITSVCHVDIDVDVGRRTYT